MGFFLLEVSKVSYILPGSGLNPRNIQSSLAGAIIESYKIFLFLRIFLQQNIFYCQNFFFQHILFRLKNVFANLFSLHNLSCKNFLRQKEDIQKAAVFLVIFHIWSRGDYHKSILRRTVNDCLQTSKLTNVVSTKIVW